MKNHPELEQKIQHTYFGDGTASEVISTLQYQTTRGEDWTNGFIEVGMAFGGKK